jgi:hypothetical protein
MVVDILQRMDTMVTLMHQPTVTDSPVGYGYRHRCIPKYNNKIRSICDIQNKIVDKTSILVLLIRFLSFSSLE